MNNRYVLVTILVVLIGCLGFLIYGGVSTDKKLRDQEEMQKQIENGPKPIATMVIKDMGTIKLELEPTKAPNTVNNFIALANSEFYNGLTFHRIAKDFVIQGGDPEGTGQGGPGYSIKGEFSENGVENDLSHEKGVISMARQSVGYDTAGSQFFIVTGDDAKASLDGSYAAFGKVIEGMDIVEKINETSVGEDEVPATPVVIESVTVDTQGVTYPEPEKISE